MVAEHDDIDGPRKKLAQLLKSTNELTLNEVQRQLGVPIQSTVSQPVTQHKLSDYEKIVEETTR